jgi:uncharacterized protein (DUF58 family)
MACALVVALASIAQRSGDPVGGAIVAANGTVSVRARTRADVVRELMTALGSVRPSGAAALAPALALAPERARVVVVSDLLGDEDGVRRACAVRATAGGDVHALHIVSRAELAPPADAPLVVDPEDASVLRPFDAATREAYCRHFASWRDETARAWRLAGATYREVLAEDEVTRVVRLAVAAAPAGA